MKHTIEDDFQHFLSYSGLQDEPADIIHKMRMAFNAARHEPIEIFPMIPYPCPSVTDGVHTYDLDGVRCIQCGAFKYFPQKKCPALISGPCEYKLDECKLGHQPALVCIHCGVFK